MKDNETIAQFLKITKLPFEINYDGNVIYYENSDGYWFKREFDSNGKKTYYEDFTGYWVKREFDSDGNQTFFENSDGSIIDYRPKTTITWEEISEKFGIDPDKLKIKNKGS